MNLFRKSKPVEPQNVLDDTSILLIRERIDEAEKRAIDADRRLAEFQATMGFK